MPRNFDIVQIEIRVIDRGVIVHQEFFPLDERQTDVETATQIFWMAVGYIMSKFAGLAALKE